MAVNLMQQRTHTANDMPRERSNTGMGTVPRAPRKMIQRENPPSETALNRIRDEEASKLYPRLKLFEALSVFKDRQEPRAKSSDPVCEARRDFLDSFAYLCDTDKGGKTVTAAALQELPNSNIFWLAANEGISNGMKKYMNDILERTNCAPSKDQSAVQGDIFRLAIEKCGQRIRFYKNELRKSAKECRKALGSKERDDNVTNLLNKLNDLSKTRSSMTTEACVDFCYNMRGTEIDYIKNISTTAGDDFIKLAHYIWRIGATRSAAIAVVKGRFQVPSLQQISCIRRVNAPETVDKTIDARVLSPHEVLYNIPDDTASHNPLQFEQAFGRLFQLNPPGPKPIHKKMAEGETITTRVHAELQVADRFSRSPDMKFVDGDKYIGCSKPACYFCYNWLCYHKHVYVKPATHHKIIPGCRGPDHDLNEKGADVLTKMYKKISRQIGQDILEFLQNDSLLRRQYMSTEASTRPQSRLSNT